MIKVSIGLAIMLVFLGSAPFAKSAPKCPKGYDLVRNTCVRQTANPGTPRCPSGYVLKSGSCKKI